MKFADIAKRAKATKIATVLTDENGVQWVNVGAAVYRLEGLPKMSSEDFLRLAGVSEEKIGSFYVEGNNIPETSLRNETGDEIALTSDMAGLVVDMDGYRLMPFYTALHGVIWLDVKNMEPIMKGGYKLSAVLPAEVWERLDDCGEGRAGADCHYSREKDVGVPL